MFERFTGKARALVTRAQFEARARNHNFIGREHLLLAMINSTDGNVAARIIEGLGVTTDAVRAQVDEHLVNGADGPKKQIPFTRDAKKVFELSLREALKLGHNYVGTEHILLALVAEQGGTAARALHQLGVTYERVNGELLGFVSQAVRDESADWVVLAGASAATASTREDANASSPQPNCPNCRASLARTLAYKLLNASEDGGPGTIKLCVVYCEACGHTLLTRAE